MMNVETHAILITGAASGIGRECARFFSSLGWFVGAIDQNETALQELAGELNEDRQLLRALDVTDEAAFCKAVGDFSCAAGGRLDILFNNAGIGAGGGFLDADISSLDRLLRVNVLGVMIGVRVAYPLLSATPNSLCLNMSSASAIFGLPGIAAYSASKGAIKTLTEALSIELRAAGIRVSDILPGLVRTSLVTDGAWSNDVTGPFRMSNPRDVAETVLAAYTSDQLHWYLPDNLSELTVQAANDPQKFRTMVDERSGPYAWMDGLFGPRE